MLDKSVICLYLEHFCSGYHVKRQKEKGQKNLEATEKKNLYINLTLGLSR